MEEVKNGLYSIYSITNDNDNVVFWNYTALRDPHSTSKQKSV